MQKKHISILTACYNEEANVELLITAVEKVFEKLPNYSFEHVFIDNCSVDSTVTILRRLAASKKHVKVIINAKNFGWIRSPFHGIMQCKGDAVIPIVADFQDPPELIYDFVKKWEEGYSMVLGIKNKSEEKSSMFFIRKFFYKLLNKASAGEQPTIKNFTGFGLYEQRFISILRDLNDPYPYLRGLVSELGYNKYEMDYKQPQRFAGKTSSNFFALYDVAMLGFTSHSKLPLRLSAFVGFFSAILSLLVAICYFIYKLIYWYEFQIGTAPMVIGIFFFSSVQLFFIGVIGEYIGSINTQIRKRPLVIEKERINFE